MVELARGKMPAIVIMGVSGCGKSTLGSQLARATGLDFIEGDDLHPPLNVAKMAAGMALTDDDRWPWLEKVAVELIARAGKGCVTSCSALKRDYRDFIRDRLRGDVVFVLPDLCRDVLWHRMHSRSGHYMPPSLLDGQIAALQYPEPDELALVVDGMRPPTLLVDDVVNFLAARSCPVRLTAPECD